MKKRMKLKKLQAHTIKEMIASGRDKCEKCGRLDMLTIDHIIPYSLLMQFGLATEETYHDKYVTVLCRICNAYKADKIDMNDRRVKPLLEELIKRI